MKLTLDPGAAALLDALHAAGYAASEREIQLDPAA